MTYWTVVGVYAAGSPRLSVVAVFRGRHIDHYDCDGADAESFVDWVEACSATEAAQKVLRRDEAAI